MTSCFLAGLSTAGGNHTTELEAQLPTPQHRWDATQYKYFIVGLEYDMSFTEWFPLIAFFFNFPPYICTQMTLSISHIGKTWLLPFSLKIANSVAKQMTFYCRCCLNSSYLNNVDVSVNLFIVHFPCIYLFFTLYCSTFQNLYFLTLVWVFLLKLRVFFCTSMHTSIQVQNVHTLVTSAPQHLMTVIMASGSCHHLLLLFAEPAVCWGWCWVQAAVWQWPSSLSRSKCPNEAPCRGWQQLAQPSLMDGTP